MIDLLQRGGATSQIFFFLRIDYFISPIDDLVIEVDR